MAENKKKVEFVIKHKPREAIVDCPEEEERSNRKIHPKWKTD